MAEIIKFESTTTVDATVEKLVDTAALLVSTTTVNAPAMPYQPPQIYLKETFTSSTTIVVKAVPHNIVASDDEPDKIIPPNGSIENDFDSSTDVYSSNRIKQGDAESGLMDPWIHTGAEVVDGGVGESTKVYRVPSSMLHKVNMEGTQPPDILIGGRFLPDQALPEENIEVLTYARITVSYADGTLDEVIVPMRGVASDGA